MDSSWLMFGIIYTGGFATCWLINKAIECWSAGPVCSHRWVDIESTAVSNGHGRIRDRMCLDCAATDYRVHRFLLCEREAKALLALSLESKSKGDSLCSKD